MNQSHDKIHITTKDFLVSGEEFVLVENKRFGYLETTPQPHKDKLSSYYDTDAYISHTDSKKGIIPFLYQLIKQYSLQKKVRLITKLNEGCGSILDIGAGTGEFLKIAKSKGWNVHGVEVNEKAKRAAISKHIQLESHLDSFKDHQFDVVTMWHVLEHLPDLHEQIRKIQELIKPGGHLIIAVPNYKSFDALYYREYWAAYDVPRHLWHFSQKNIKELFSDQVRLVKTYPMIFDAFYVSLLSERYKRGNTFSFKAIWIGLQSNRAARRSGEYSSLIYHLKK